MKQGKKVRTLVIMNASDEKFVKNIIGYIKMMVGDIHWYNNLKWFKHVKCQKLDPTHPDIKVISVETNCRIWGYIKTLLTDQYPEQCLFDINMEDVRK